MPFLVDFPAAAATSARARASALDLALGSLDGAQHARRARSPRSRHEGQGPGHLPAARRHAEQRRGDDPELDHPARQAAVDRHRHQHRRRRRRRHAATATEKIETGITLVVTPQVSSDGFVLLDIYAKSSQAGLHPHGRRHPDGNQPRGELARAGAATARRSCSAASIATPTSDNASGVPYLKTIPALGWLFRADSSRSGARICSSS